MARATPNSRLTQSFSATTRDIRAQIVSASRKSWPESEVKRTTSKSSSRKSWPVAAGEGSPPRAEGGASPVNAYWWTRKVLAENEVDLDDDDDLADGKSRVVFTSVGSC